MKLVPYNNDYASEWNSFVDKSCNATFIIKRSYMDYHSDRFEDCSLLFYEKEKIIAIFPANIKDGEVYSHAGLTYGGLIWERSLVAEKIFQVMDMILEYYKTQLNVKLIHYKPTPYIYRTYPSEEDLYYLTTHGATLEHRQLASSIFLPNKLSFSELRQRKVKKANLYRFKVSWVTATKRWQAFWNILTTILKERHGATPVHTMEEMYSLYSKHVHNIRLVSIMDDTTDEMLAGTVLFKTQQVVHAQYIAASDKGCEMGALDALFKEIIKHYVIHEKLYFDFGNVTENGGSILNTGLLFQKEGFGGRGICYDEYLIKL